MTTWRGTMRSLAAAGRAAEREAQRRHRVLLKQHQASVKQAALQQSELEVQLHESLMDRIVSVHQDCSEPWDWTALNEVDPPPKPALSHGEEKVSQLRLHQYSATFWDWLLRRETSRRTALQAAVHAGRAADEKQNAVNQVLYQKECSEWQTLRDIAQGILARDLKAYMRATDEARPCSEITEIGSTVSFRSVESWYMEASVDIRGSDVVPTEIKTLTQSGKLSVKKMPQGRSYEIYQDYVCSCALRVGRELFALLPIEMAVVHALDDLLDTATGYKAREPILSVAFTRIGLSELNFESIDCSDSMKNFVHNMAFSKAGGFSAVERLNPSEFSRRPA